VPAFESAVTNDAIMGHFGIKPANFGPMLKGLRYLPFRNKILRNGYVNKKLIDSSMLRLAKFYKAAGLDLMPTFSVLVPVKLYKDGYIDEFGRIMHTEYYVDGTEVLGYLGGWFKSFDDYESFEHPDPAWPARVDLFMGGKKAQEASGNAIFAIGGIGGMMEVTWEGFGIQNFAKLLFHRKEAKKVFDDRGKFAVELVKILAEHGAKVILAMDDYGFKNGLFMSPKNYREYVLPWLRQMCNAAHERDAKIILHSDGDLSDILDDLVDDCHIDGLNPIEPTTANPAYNIFDIKQKYGDRLTITGNVSPMMLATGTIEDIQAYTKRLMRECAPGGGYILASGHSINPAVTLDRWQAMMQIRDKYGQYPILEED